jgi:hypothetical protein
MHRTRRLGNSVGFGSRNRLWVGYFRPGRPQVWVLPLSAGNFTRRVGPAVGWVYLIRTGRHGYSLFVCTVMCHMMLIMCTRETGKQPKDIQSWFNSHSILINFSRSEHLVVSTYLDSTLLCSPLRSMPATPAPAPPSAYMAAVIKSASESS